MIAIEIYLVFNKFTNFKFKKKDLKNKNLLTKS